MQCPHCSAEVSKDDLFCGECGKRLPTAPREGRRIQTPLVIGVAAVAIVGCIAVAVILAVIVGGAVPLFPQASPTPTPLPPTSTPIPPTSTPEVMRPNYTNPILGFSMWYPEQWIYEEDEEQVVFASSQEVIDADEVESGAGMLVVVEELEGDPIEGVVEDLASLLVSGEDMDISDPQGHTIGGYHGTILTFQGTIEDTQSPVRGFVAGAGYDGWGYLFVGVSAHDDWSEYGADLEAMLDSVQLSGPSPVLPTPPPPTSPTPLPPSPVAGADVYEPDDSIDQANPITTDGTAQTHNFHQEGDVDYVSFAAQEGTQYTIETGNLGAGCDTIVTVYDQGGTELGRDDDGADEALASRLPWTADSSGTYYVEITSYLDITGPGTEYDVWIVVGGPPPTPTPPPVDADPYESDDSIAEAGPINTDGAPQAHNLHAAGDHDYVSFVSEAGIGYAIETLDLGSDIDTIMYLYDADGNELASDDDGGEEAWASRIVWIAPSSGTYYAMIRDLGDDSSGANATYSIKVTTMGAIEGDRYEPDDSIAQAGPITTDGATQTHTFHTSTDADYVYFAAQEGVEYTIETGDLQGDCDTRIYLYDEDGQELDYDDDGGEESYASRIVWVFDSSGTYYVRIEDYHNRAGPDVSYAVWVSATG